LQDITYTAVIRRHPGGPPAELVLTAPPPGYSPTIEAELATIITRDGTSGFRPGAYPYDWPTHNAYRGVPNPLDVTFYTALDPALISKTGVNWANDYPTTVAFVEDPATRRTTACAAKLRTLQFLWYVRSVLGESEWSVAPEEGFDTPYNREENDCPEIPAELAALERQFPVMPYVREGRRMIGQTTLTVADIRREGMPPVPVRRWPTSIAVGDYGSDLHACNCGDGGDAVLEAGLERCSDIGPEPGGWFQVPIEVLIPETADGFLAVEKNISVSRLVNGAIRLQPIAMYTGQAAGVLAGLAVRDGIQPRAVRPIDVQWVLVQSGARISAELYADVARSDLEWRHIQIVATHGIMNGDAISMFRHTAVASRGEAAAVVQRLFGLPLMPPATPSFADVPASHPFYAQIEAVRAAGITAGCSASPPSFCPDVPVTRAQLMVFMGRALGLDPATARATPYYDDVPPTDSAFPWIQLLSEREIAFGCSAAPPLFCPETSATRGHLAIFATRIRVLLLP
jgi:hypothetical protein